MNLLIEYVSSLAPWVYGLCGLIALYYLFKVRSIRLDRRQAIFSLEREQAARLLTRVTVRVAAIILIMAGTYTVSDVLGRALEIEQSLGQAGRLEISSVNEETAPQDPVPTATQPAVVGEAGGQIDLRNVPVCDTESATIQAPGVGEEITGNVTVSGTAANDNFSDYSLEIAPGLDPAEEDFTSLGIGRNQVHSGELWKFDASQLIKGPYTIRLRVLDNTGIYVGSCQVTVRVVAS